MSVITYCYQKNPLRVRTKLHILFYYAWSSQRFKSLPSILCRKVVRAKPVTCRTPVILSKTPYRPAIWTEVAGLADSLKHGRLAHIRSQFSLFRRSPTHKNLPLATFCTSEQLLFGSFCRSKKNKSVPFGNFAILFVRHKKYGKKAFPLCGNIYFTIIEK